MQGHTDERSRRSFTTTTPPSATSKGMAASLASLYKSSTTFLEEAAGTFSAGESKEWVEWQAWRSARMDAGDEEPREGYLMKQGHMRRNWLRRYFVIKGDTLLYFSDKGGELKGSFALAHSEIRIDDEFAKRAHSFTIFSEKASLKLQAASQAERNVWTCALDPQFRMSEMRKKYEDGLSTVADGCWFEYLNPEEEDANDDVLKGIKEEDREELDLSILNGSVDSVARLHIQLSSDRSRFFIGASKSVHGYVFKLNALEQVESSDVEPTQFTLCFRGRGKGKVTSVGVGGGGGGGEGGNGGGGGGSISGHDEGGETRFSLGTGSERERNAWAKAFRRCMLVNELVKQQELPRSESVRSLTGGAASIPTRKQKNSVLSAMSAAATAASQVLKAKISGKDSDKDGVDADGNSKALRTNVSMKTLNNVGPCLSHALHTSLTEEYEVETDFKLDGRPTVEDYNAKMRGEASCDEQMYEFRAYAPRVFRKLRRKRGLSNVEFAKSMHKLSGGAVGEGKSGMVFFMSEDKRFIIKTVKESEKKFFFHQGVLKGYYEHMDENAQSLLCPFLGLYKIRMLTEIKEVSSTRKTIESVVEEMGVVAGKHGRYKASPWIIVIAMVNAFNTPLDIHEKYDLKGSTRNRYVDESTIPAGKVAVLKDLNFKSKIYLRAQDAEALMNQIKVDAAFLARWEIMDYSLLLGIHNPEDASSYNALEENAGGEGAALATTTLAGSAWNSFHGGLEGRSHLSTKANPTYFVSVIDFLQLYDLGKRLENAIKGKISRNEATISAVDGKAYAERFVAYVSRITVGLEGKGFLSEKEKRDAEKADEERQEKAMKKMQAEKEQRRADAVMLAQANRLAKFQASLVRGIDLIKHPRQGTPRKRVLFVDKGKLCCAETIKAGSNKTFSLSKVKRVVKGCETAVFKRTLGSEASSLDKSALCFSIIFDDRSLDLEMRSEKERDAVVSGLLQLVDEPSLLVGTDGKRSLTQH